VIGASTILHLHNELYSEWYKYEGTAVIGADGLAVFSF
jgi:hypothetical protein